MNRLLALVAVAALGTGCVSEDTCDVRITWPDFESANGALVGCGGAGVEWVDVWVDGGGGPRVSVPCDRGFVDLTVSPGYHFWSVEGVVDERIGDEVRTRIVNRHAFELGDSCGLWEIETRPAQGSVDLQYLFYSGGAPIDPQVCAEDSLLWLSVYDWIATDYAERGDVAYQCGGDFILPLPVGEYTLDWMEETGPAPNYALESADCTPRSFVVDPGARTAVPVNLDVNATSECPRRALLLSSDSAGRASMPPSPVRGAPPVAKERLER